MKGGRKRRDVEPAEIEQRAEPPRSWQTVRAIGLVVLAPRSNSGMRPRARMVSRCRVMHLRMCAGVVAVFACRSPLAVLSGSRIAPGHAERAKNCIF